MPEAAMHVESRQEVTNNILSHYDAHARDLPWRSLPGNPAPDPYRVWLSEIMLQQTTVAAVKPYFAGFTARWPTVHALASARDEDVMSAWAGLGYYARARNLLACARVVVADHGGMFPAEERTLLSLPGVGTYTAAAIASIAYGKRAVVVDGNVERVMARFHAVETPLPAAKAMLRDLADHYTPVDRAGDYAQAVMDIGATICTPRSPVCSLCPIAANCKGRSTAERYPVKPPKIPKPERCGTAWWIECDGKVLLIQRPAKGLLGGMAALPSCDWQGPDAEPPFAAQWQDAGSIAHVFTHFALTLRVGKTCAPITAATDFGGRWHPIDQIESAGLPTVFAKAAARARATSGEPL
jgi:A/G-specific adenine glycosylase